jgi:DNA-binding transcriptional MocR family regulator
LNRPSPSPQPRLYELVAGQIISAIESGALRPGDRLPSVRQLSRQRRVSISTVLEAYAHLEATGVLEVRPQSGHYVRARHQLPEPRSARPSPEALTVSLSDLIPRLHEERHENRTIGFGTADTALGMLPTRRLGHLLAAAARSAEHGGAEYDPPAGYLPLRQQIARRSLDWGCALSPEELIVTHGAIQALNLCLLAVARRGDTVAIESPAFLGILQILEAHGLRALEIPCDPREGMRLDALEVGLQRHRVAAVLAVTNFSNPLGSCMPDASKERLVDMLARREIPLIEDDVFGDLHHGPERPRVAKAFDRRGLVMLCGSFSKTLAQGYRVGWVAAGRHQERVQLLQFSQTGATMTLPQRAVATFLEGGGYDRHLRTLRRRLAESMHRVSAAVGEYFPEGTRMTQPRGGILLWVELPRKVSALQLYRRAMAEGISFVPGPVFSARQRLTNFIRLNTALQWNEQVESALKRLGELAKEPI